MNYLEQLRAREASKSFLGDPPPTDRTDRTPFVSSAGAATHAKNILHANAVQPPQPVEAPAKPAANPILAPVPAAKAVLLEFRAALVTGRLQVCCNGKHYQFATDPAAMGQCRSLNESVWPFVPFVCSRFELSPTPAVRAVCP